MSLVKKSLSVVVVFMLGTLISYANVKVISKNTKAVKVVFENVQKNHPLTIIDAEGIVLHKENVSNDGDLVKFFDFSFLKEGMYKIEVDRDFETLIRTFEVKNNEVIFNIDSDKIVFNGKTSLFSSSISTPVISPIPFFFIISIVLSLTIESE